MPIKVLMPALSPTMTEGNLAKWIMKEGDKVKPGSVMAEIETDKATMEMEAVDEGVLAKIIVPEATEAVAVNSLIAIILEEGEDASSIESFIAEHNAKFGLIKEEVQKIQNNDHSVQSNKASSIVVNSTIEGKDRVFASPLARRIASEKNISLRNITGSGPHGRIIKADVLATKSQISSQWVRDLEEYSIKKHSNVGKIIAKRLLESKQTIPHFYLSIECCIDKLLDARAELNSFANDAEYKLSVNDFIVKASALALKDVPDVNASWDEQNLIIYNNVDISVAVSAPTGLVTPVVKNADYKSLIDLSNEIKSLAGKARDNKLKPEEFQGGGFTISNLGMYGIKKFSAIINPPQSCILAVGEGSKRPIVQGNEIKIATMIDFTLSCDHRVVDGVLGAKFLAKFKEYIEHPIKMLWNK